MFLAVFARPGSARTLMVCRGTSLVGMAAIEIGGDGRIAWPWFTLIGTLITLAVAALLGCRWRVIANQPPATMRR